MKKVLVTGLVLCVALPAAANVFIPMDTQMNVGRTTAQSPTGDAMYDPFGADPMFFTDDGPGTEGFRRQYLLPGGGSANWYYGYLDFYLAGVTNDYLDLSAAPTIEFDARFYQDSTNSDPYADAPIFVRLYTYDDDGTGTYPTYVGHRDFSIVYGTQAPWSDPQYPTFSHVSLDPNDLTFDSDGNGTADVTEGGAFDISRVSRVRFYGTDWFGAGADYVDIKNFAVTPEPSTLAVIALGGVALLRRRR